MKRLILLALTALLFSTNTYAADEPFEATIIIRQAISISEVSALNFGTVEATQDAQNIVIAAGDKGSAQFDIAGDALTTVTWSVTEDTINMTSGANSIAVDTFTVSGGGTGVLPQTGVRVGATARVSGNQATGTYTGSATFNVVYN